MGGCFFPKKILINMRSQRNDPLFLHMQHLNTMATLQTDQTITCGQVFPCNTGNAVNLRGGLESNMGSATEKHEMNFLRSKTEL